MDMTKICLFLLAFSSGKIDPALKSLELPSLAPPFDRRVDLFVITDGDTGEGVKGRRISEKFPIFHVKLVKEEAERISELPWVKFVYLTRYLSPQLDVSSKSAGFADLFERYPSLSGGKGVMVGVIDTGIDIYHPDFLNPDGSTKIAFLWDQTVDGKPPSGFDYGNECSSYEINRKACGASDPSSHGTHISGIIFSEDEIYTGLAKESVFVFVKTDYNEARVIDGIEYIFDLSQRFGLPAVVNLSLGGHVGPHDGTSILEETITSMTGNGKIITASSGNDGNKEIHIGYDVPATSGVVLNIPSFFGLGGSAILEIWYEKGDELEFLAGVIDETYPEVITSTPWTSLWNEVRITLFAGGVYYGDVFLDTTVTDYPLSGKRYVYIEFSKSSGTKPFVILQRPSKRDPNGSRLNGWLNSLTGRFEKLYGVRDLKLYGKTEKVTFHSGDNLHTVMVPSTAKNVFSVGSYVSRVWWEYDDGKVYQEDLTVGVRSIFSGVGPSLNSWTGIKPLIKAPGQWVISSMPRGMGAPSYMIAPDGLHYALDGTSISTPHLTAGIALLLQKDPYLGPEELGEIICNSAKRDEWTGEEINEMWGCGKMDIVSAYEMVEEVPKEKMAPEFLFAKREGDGIVIATKGLSMVEVHCRSKIWSDMSYSEKHYIEDEGEISGKAVILLESPHGGMKEIEVSIETGGCGCVEGGMGGVLSFLFVYFFFFLNKLFDKIIRTKGESL